jgi:protein PhnA
VRVVSADTDPSSGADFVHATFSHRGRRKIGTPLSLILKDITTIDIKVRDANGALLVEGDTVTLIKDLKLKGSSTVLKRGTVIRNIHLTDNEDEIEGRSRLGPAIHVFNVSGAKDVDARDKRGHDGCRARQDFRNFRNLT